MKGRPGSLDLLLLEMIFNYDRNRDSISVIRKQVENYERLVKGQAEKLEKSTIELK